MRIPVIQGVIERRILVNYRVDPDVLARVLPEPFRPKLVHGVGMAGICLIRLRHIRPFSFPRFLGIGSENAAHRIAAEWEQHGELRQGVYIPRRDTSLWLNKFAGGKLFPGVHHHARFWVHEQDGRYSVALSSRDGSAHVAVEGCVTSEFPATSVFHSLEAASNFFEAGSLGYSATAKNDEYDGLELRTLRWEVQPLAVQRVASSFFEDRCLFPSGSVEFDCALLMREVEHEWHGKERLRVVSRLDSERLRPPCA